MRTRLAVVGGVVAVALLVIAAVLGMNSALSPVERADSLRALGWIGFPAIGALLVARRPTTRIAWLLVAGGLALGLGELGAVLQRQAVVLDAAVDWRGYAGVYLGVLVPTGWMLLGASLLRFPSDRLTGRAAPYVSRLLIAAAAIHPIRVFSSDLELHLGAEQRLIVDNPLVVPVVTAIADRAVPITGVGISLSAGIVIHLVVRGARSRGVERQQMKWIAYAAAVYLVALLGIGAAHLADVGSEEALEFSAAVAAVVSFNGIAAAIGLAVTRYRLYEVDRLASRTATYAALTLVLGAVYVTGVVGVARLLPTGTVEVTGDLLVAASTLAVAALFSPVRRRIQAIVDRRFNRARYDAARTVERFSQHLRDEIDIDALAERLGQAAAGAVQPDRVGVWFRPAPAAPRRE